MKLFLVSPRAESKGRISLLAEEHFPGSGFALPEHGSEVWVLAAPDDQTPSNRREDRHEIRGAEQFRSGGSDSRI